jgi:hypothetical protein
MVSSWLIATLKEIDTLGHPQPTVSQLRSNGSMQGGAAVNMLHSFLSKDATRRRSRRGLRFLVQGSKAYIWEGQSVKSISYAPINICYDPPPPPSYRQVIGG